ncbi:hypothetical protein QVD99_001569 [Batrachochytrium dendrobatidis]|nr:hypothetical protein QVD99_001569 [Batrachochytrium dendrobatidis]
MGVGRDGNPILDLNHFELLYAAADSGSPPKGSILAPAYSRFTMPKSLDIRLPVTSDCRRRSNGTWSHDPFRIDSMDMYRFPSASFEYDPYLPSVFPNTEGSLPPYSFRISVHSILRTEMA